MKESLLVDLLKCYVNVDDVQNKVNYLNGSWYTLVNILIGRPLLVDDMSRGLLLL